MNSVIICIMTGIVLLALAITIKSLRGEIGVFFIIAGALVCSAETGRGCDRLVTNYNGGTVVAIIRGEYVT